MYRPGHVGASLLLSTPFVYLLIVRGQPALAAIGLLIVLATEPIPDMDLKTRLLDHRGASHTIVAITVVAAIAMGLTTLFGLVGTAMLALAVVVPGRLAGLETASLIAGAALAIKYVAPGAVDRAAADINAFVSFIGSGSGSIITSSLASLGTIDPALGIMFAGAAAAFGIVTHLAADVITPSGISVLWPLSSQRYSLGLWTAANPIANTGLFFGGLVVLAGVVSIAV